MQDLQLENLKIGDEVVSIRPKNKGFKYGGIRIITAFDERLNGWRYGMVKNQEMKNCGFFPSHGGCKDFMSKNPNSDYYFSANPKHIQAARKQHKQAQIKREKQEAKDKARFEEFHGKFKALMEEYGASIHAIQTNGDDQGVEMDVEISIGNQSQIIY